MKKDYYVNLMAYIHFKYVLLPRTDLAVLVIHSSPTVNNSWAAELLNLQMHALSPSGKYQCTTLYGCIPEIHLLTVPTGFPPMREQCQGLRLWEHLMSKLPLCSIQRGKGVHSSRWPWLFYSCHSKTLWLVSAAWGKSIGWDFSIGCEPEDRSLHQYQEKSLFPEHLFFETRQGKIYFKVLYGNYDFLKITLLTGDI